MRVRKSTCWQHRADIQFFHITIWLQPIPKPVEFVAWHVTRSACAIWCQSKSTQYATMCLIFVAQFINWMLCHTKHNTSNFTLHLSTITAMCTIILALITFIAITAWIVLPSISHHAWAWITTIVGNIDKYSHDTHSSIFVFIVYPLWDYHDLPFQYWSNQRSIRN